MTQHTDPDQKNGAKVTQDPDSDTAAKPTEHSDPDPGKAAKPTVNCCCVFVVFWG